MKEVAALLERARKYLSSAASLIALSDYESAVSRCYYAMFYAAESLLLSKGLTFSSHKAVISAFGEHFVKTAIFPKEMSKELNRAFEKRQVSDYEYTFVISKEESEALLKSATDFIEKIIRYLKLEEGEKYENIVGC